MTGREPTPASNEDLASRVLDPASGLCEVSFAELADRDQAMSDRVACKCFNHPLWTMRNVAARYLIERGEAIADLVIPFLDSRDPDQAYWSIRIVGSLGPSAIPHLSGLVVHLDSDRRYTAVTAMSAIRDMAAAPHLIKALADTSWQVRKAAAEGLERLGSPVVPLLLKAFNDLNEDVKYWSIRLIGRLMSEKSVPSLAKILRNSDRNLRYYAVLALGEIPSPKSIDMLIETLSDKIWLIRRLAADMLEKIGKPAVPRLKKAFKSGDPDIQYWSMRLLGRILKSRAVPSLSKQLSVKDDNLRYYTILALGETGSKRAIPALIKCFPDKSWFIREQAAEVISSFGDDAMRPLKKAMSSRNLDIKYWAIKVLGALGGKCYEPLMEAFPAEDSKGQNYILGSMKPTRDKAFLRFLVKCLESPCWPVRNRSAELLRAVGPASRRVLIKARDTGSEDVKYWAERVLSDLENDAFAPLLESLETRNLDGLKKWAASFAARKTALTNASMTRRIIEHVFTLDTPFCQEISKVLGKAEGDGFNEIVAAIRKTGHINRHWLFRSLGLSREPGVVPILLEMYNHDRDHRMAVLEAMSMKESPQCLDILIHELSSPGDEAQKELICRFLARNSLRRIRGRIHRILSSPAASGQSWIKKVVKVAVFENTSEVLSIVKGEVTEEATPFLKELAELKDSRKTEALKPYLESSRGDLLSVAVAAVRNCPDSETLIKILELLDAGHLRSDQDIKSVIDLFTAYSSPLQVAETVLLMDLGIQKLEAWSTDFITKSKRVRLKKGIGAKEIPDQAVNSELPKKEGAPPLEMLGINADPADDSAILTSYQLEDLMKVPYFRLVKVLGNVLKVQYGEIQTLVGQSSVESVVTAAREFLLSSDPPQGTDKMKWLRRRVLSGKGSKK